MAIVSPFLPSITDFILAINTYRLDLRDDMADLMKLTWSERMKLVTQSTPDDGIFWTFLPKSEKFWTRQIRKQLMRERSGTSSANPADTADAHPPPSRNPRSHDPIPSTSDDSYDNGASSGDSPGHSEGPDLERGLSQGA